MADKTNSPGNRGGAQSTRRTAGGSKRSASAREPGRRRHPLRIAFKIFAIGVGGGVVLVGGASIGYATAKLKGLPQISAATFTNESEASVVYDRNGKVIGRYTMSGNRQPISSLNQVSVNLTNALVAAEDKTFWHNVGINPLAMARAFVEDVTTHHIESGASTITQQTVKLAVFPEQQRTTKRKIQEIALALKLNHILSKQEVMTDYMNWVYMGQLNGLPAYGMKTASAILFHKDPNQLTIPEAAMLAGMVNNPYYLSPYQFPDSAVTRQHYVLHQMLLNHMISAAQYQSALSFNILKDIHPQQTQTLVEQYPYLMIDNITPIVCEDLVKQGLYNNVQAAYDALPTAGYKIYTSIDLAIQNHVDSVLADDKLFGNSNLPVPGTNGKQYDLYNVGFTLMDNQTGGILAIGGGRDSSADYQHDQIDHSDIARQPGSSIKPLIDYGPAFDLGKETPATPLDDIPTVFYKGLPYQYAPHDDENYWHGIVSVRRALVESINVPAVRTLNLLTPQVGTSYLAKVGIPVGATTVSGQPTLVAADTTHLASAIGGLVNGVTVQQMTSAYTVFPNQGIWRQSYLVSKVTSRTGNTLFQFHQQVQQVFSPQTAWLLTNILHGVVYQPDGTAYAVGQRLPGYQLSGKTGTTDHETDGWFVGYTQQYTAGIWMGYNHEQHIPGYFYPLKFSIWSDLMAPVLEKHPPVQPWPQPPGIVKVAVCHQSGELPTNFCRADNAVYSEYFAQGTEPTQYDTVHVQADYTVIGGQKYLATTNTPAADVRTGIFIDPPFQLPPGVTTAQSGEYVPTQADPRGGSVLLGPTSGQAPTATSAPSSVTAAYNNGEVQVNWSPVPGASGYVIARATAPNGPYTTVSGPQQSLSFTDTQLPVGATVLYYQVFTTAATGLSGPSVAASVVVAAAGTGPAGAAGGNAVGDNAITDNGNSVSN